MLHVVDNVFVVGRSVWGDERPLSRGGSCCVYVVDGGSELALIDGGSAEGVEDVVGNIRAAGLDPAMLRKVLLTHAHSDHVLGVAEFMRRYGVTVYGSRITKETVEGGDGIYANAHGLRLPVAEGGRVHEVVKAGDEITVGNVNLSVLELPGHTPDGLGFTLQLKDGLGCFSGDTAIGDQGAIKGAFGWIDAHWNSNLTDYKRSLEQLRALNLHAFFPGHGVSHIGAEAVRQSLDHCLWRLKLLMDIPNLNVMLPVKY